MITVRKVSRADVQTVVAYIRKKAEFDRGLGCFDGQLGTTPELIEKALFENPIFAYSLIAAIDSKDYGFAFYHFRFSSFQARPILWLDDLYVDSDVRRSGTGLEIMSVLKEEALFHHCTQIAWTADGRNMSGVPFYEKIGATLVSQNGSRLAYSISPTVLSERIQKIKLPNQSSEATPGPVTPRAEPRVAPAPGVPHL
jgi:GNAT superfamily N-acetyltransferase